MTKEYILHTISKKFPTPKQQHQRGLDDKIEREEGGGEITCEAKFGFAFSFYAQNRWPLREEVAEKSQMIAWANLSLEVTAASTRREGGDGEILAIALARS